MSKAAAAPKKAKRPIETKVYWRVQWCEPLQSMAELAQNPSGLRACERTFPEGFNGEEQAREFYEAQREKVIPGLRTHTRLTRETVELWGVT